MVKNMVKQVLFPTCLCGVLVLLAAIPPDSVLPSFPPSFRPSVLLLHTQSSCHLTSFPHLFVVVIYSPFLSSPISHTHNHLIISHTHTHTHLVISHLTFTHTIISSSHTHTHLVIISPLSLISLIVFHSLSFSFIST